MYTDFYVKPNLKFGLKFYCKFRYVNDDFFSYVKYSYVTFL